VGKTGPRPIFTKLNADTCACDGWIRRTRRHRQI
jgi:hypothetical protein